MIKVDKQTLYKLQISKKKLKNMPIEKLVRLANKRGYKIPLNAPPIRSNK